MDVTREPRASALPAPPAALGWTVLVLSSLAMFGNYYVYDCIAPLADLLKSEAHLTDTQIGSLNAIYSLPNVFMVLVGGVIVDRVGAARACVLFAAVCFAGTLLGAIAPTYGALVVGRLLFGLGAESLIVGVTTQLGYWFKARRLGLMLGLNLSIARAGSFVADWSPTFARPLYDAGVGPPLWVAAGLALVSLAAAAAAYAVEAGAAKRFTLGAPAKSERFEWRDALRFDRAYWYLVGLCVAIYSVLFPFRSTFAIAYFQDAHGLSREAAGQLNSWVFLAAIFATPLFGWLLDRKGRRTASLAAGSLLLLPVFPILIWTTWSPWTSNVLLGLTFSLVPAVLWPCVAHMVEVRRLGTAYGLMTMIQNIGLAGFNLAAGALNDANGAGPANARGYYPMLGMFALLSLAAVFFALLLHLHARSDSSRGL